MLSQEGELIERRVRTEPQRVAEVRESRPRVRILIESATESEWVARGLEGLGHEVIGADPKLRGFTPPPAPPPEIRCVPVMW